MLVLKGQAGMGKSGEKREPWVEYRRTDKDCMFGHRECKQVSGDKTPEGSGAQQGKAPKFPNCKTSYGWPPGTARGHSVMYPILSHPTLCLEHDWA